MKLWKNMKEGQEETVSHTVRPGFFRDFVSRRSCMHDATAWTISAEREAKSA
jgi:hypothetical protein